MAEGARQQPALIRALWRPIRVPALAIAMGMGLLVTAWGVHGLAATILWPDSLAGLRRVLDEELSASVLLAARQGWFPEMAVGFANRLYDLVFRWSGVEGMAWNMAGVQAMSIPDTVLRELWLFHHRTIEACMLITQILGLRLASMVRGLPLAALLLAVALIDGMAARAVRREAGGRESAGAYHRAKHAFVGLLGGGTCIALLWPWPVAWNWLLPLYLVALALLARHQAAAYKKHQ
jgi:hypothetical protein